MRLDLLTRPELIFPRLAGSDRSSILRAFAERMAERAVVADAERLYQRLWEREQLGSTGIGAGVAIPHCKMNGLDQVVLAIGIARDGVDFGAVDGQEVHVLFLLISPSDSPAEHLQSLAAISRWVRADHHLDQILALDTREEIYELLGRESG